MTRPMTNGALADADDVNNEFKDRDKLIIIKNWEDILSRASATTAEYQEAKFYVGKGDTNFDETTSSDLFTDGIDAAGDAVYPATSVDECDDASIDPALWTEVDSGGNLSEGSGYIELSSAASTPGATQTESIILDGYSFKDATLNKVTYFKTYYDLHIEQNAHYANYKLYISDGSTDILLKNYECHIDTHDLENTDFCKLVVNRSGQTCDLFINGSQIQSDLDISSLGAGYYLKFYSYSMVDASGGPYSSSSIVRIYYVRDLVAGDSAVFYTDNLADPGGDTIALGTLYNEDITLNGGTITAYGLTADDGSNYDSVTLETQNRFTTTGTSIGARFTITLPAVLDAANEDHVPRYGYWGIRWRAY